MIRLPVECSESNCRWKPNRLWIALYWRQLHRWSIRSEFQSDIFCPPHPNGRNSTIYFFRSFLLWHCKFIRLLLSLMATPFRFWTDVFGRKILFFRLVFDFMKLWNSLDYITIHDGPLICSFPRNLKHNWTTLYLKHSGLKKHLLPVLLDNCLWKEKKRNDSVYDSNVLLTNGLIKTAKIIKRIKTGGKKQQRPQQQQ